MKAASLKEIKDELAYKSREDLVEYCLKLTRFQKNNKELLTYLLFESKSEERYIESIKEYIDVEFKNINTKSYFFIRKSTRKILTNTKKYIRYSKNKETEVELLLYFCKNLIEFKPSIKKSTRLMNLYERQIVTIEKIVNTLHEDLQYDYNIELNKMKQ